MWTALHAAAFQEHGKVIKLLLERKADPNLYDYKNCSPVDFASVSEGIWPFFAGSQSHTTVLSI
jgi:ankyrin repeat protein